VKDAHPDDAHDEESVVGQGGTVGRRMPRHSGPAAVPGAYRQTGEKEDCPMLSQLTPATTLPTADLSKARSFYEDTLGLTPQREGMGGVFYTCGAGMVFVYESEFAGTNKATALSFDVPMSDFDAEVRALRAKGVSFMTFDMDGMDWSDGVASMGETMKSVWFADPDGNILNVSAGEM
jgi:catechol 2,3-dioxygenase-like lactoylglutathione lyase family enzyme